MIDNHSLHGGLFLNFSLKLIFTSLLAEVSRDEAKMRERRESLSFLSFLPRRERPLLAGKYLRAITSFA